MRPEEVVLRAVARAEPAVVVALVGERDAAEMGADADHDQPLVVALLDARLVGRGIREARRAGPSAPRRSPSWCGGMMKIGLPRQNTLMILAFARSGSDRPRSGRRRRSSRRPGSSGRSSGTRARQPRRRRPPHRWQCKGNRGVSCSAEDAVVTSNPFLSSQPVEPAPAWTPKKRDQEVPARDPRRQSRFFGERAKTAHPEAFYWHPCRKSASPLAPAIVQCTNPRHGRWIIAHRFARGATACGLPFIEPDIPQNTGTILRLCACLGCRRPISSNRPAFRSPTAPSAAPAWIISTR